MTAKREPSSRSRRVLLIEATATTTAQTSARSLWSGNRDHSYRPAARHPVDIRPVFVQQEKLSYENTGIWWVGARSCCLHRHTDPTLGLRNRGMEECGANAGWGWMELTFVRPHEAVALSI